MEKRRLAILIFSLLFSCSILSYLFYEVFHVNRFGHGVQIATSYVMFLTGFIGLMYFHKYYFMPWYNDPAVQRKWKEISGGPLRPAAVAGKKIEWREARVKMAPLQKDIDELMKTRDDIQVKLKKELMEMRVDIREKAEKSLGKNKLMQKADNSKRKGRNDNDDDDEVSESLLQDGEEMKDLDKIKALKSEILDSLTVFNETVDAVLHNIEELDELLVNTVSQLSDELSKVMPSEWNTKWH